MKKIRYKKFEVENPFEGRLGESFFPSCLDVGSPSKSNHTKSLPRGISNIVAGFLLRVHVPDHIVGQSNNLIPCSLRHFGETFSLSLVFECVSWEINACEFVSV
ncbi:hypothetical protein EYC84_001659 [Monilinia fructicola]|uniref:Uncharacterized protein n=1 Tax=Monilinia fructicola TaxID=38448 RepID=A0A5M9JV64_MONFR|nr:hypothetical protein EYC84_001659 [Monilinia fructicola]